MGRFRVVPPRWARVTSATDVFEEIRRGDLLVQQPYDSFRASPRPPRGRPDVIAIKTTVYRTRRVLADRLADRVRRGKQAVGVPRGAQGPVRRAAQHRVVRAMEESPCRPRLPGREDPREDDARRPSRGGEAAPLRRHRQHNASTARLYEDVGLFTRRRGDLRDVADLFNHVTGFGRPQRFRKLLVAPFAMRRGSWTRSAGSRPPRQRRAPEPDPAG